MSIPQVNAGATDRNREQTRRICELLGFDIERVPCNCNVREVGKYGFWGAKRMQDGKPMDTFKAFAMIPNGSFTLCQVVGMLEAEHVEYCGDSYAYTAYVSTQPDSRMVDPYVLRYVDPHDLTAAMDALIKVLETKGEKP